MNRVMIFGGSGSGKSTLARRVGDILDLPVVHIDPIYWLPGWVLRPPDEVTQMIRDVMSGPRWVFEGNHSATLQERTERADVIIYLDMPVWLRLWRFTRRSWAYRGRSRPDMAEGCPERWDPAFVWHYIVRYGARRRPAALAVLARCEADGRRVVHLQSRRAVRLFLDDLRAGRYEARYD